MDKSHSNALALKQTAQTYNDLLLAVKTRNEFEQDEMDQLASAHGKLINARHNFLEHHANFIEEIPMAKFRLLSKRTNYGFQYVSHTADPLIIKYNLLPSTHNPVDSGLILHFKSRCIDLTTKYLVRQRINKQPKSPIITRKEYKSNVCPQSIVTQIIPHSVNRRNLQLNADDRTKSAVQDRCSHVMERVLIGNHLLDVQGGQAVCFNQVELEPGAALEEPQPNGRKT